MGFEEKFAETQAKMTEWKNKITEAMDATEEAVNGGLAEKADEAIKAGYEAYEKAATKVMDAVDDGVESADSSFFAAQEAARLAVDQGQSKIYSGLLQAQMRIEAAKAKIAANKEAAEQASTADSFRRRCALKLPRQRSLPIRKLPSRLIRKSWSTICSSMQKAARNSHTSM